ncbi:MAG: glycosyltransferase, partial [Acidimicrobiia bacterium]
MRHLLVTNDYPPKVGGIQNYLWELWRRLPPESTAVYCTPHSGAEAFDAAQEYWIERSPEPVLIPYPWLPKRIDALAARLNSNLVLLDPAVPLGAIGPFLDHPYGVILHGAEVTIPGRLPGSKQILGKVLRGARVVVSAGEYALAEAQRCAGVDLNAIVVPPGVDTERFR